MVLRVGTAFAAATKAKAATGSTAFGFAAVAIATLSCVAGAALVFYSPSGDNNAHRPDSNHAAPSTSPARGRMILVDAKTRRVFGTFMSVAAGTMLYTALVDLLPEARSNLLRAFSDSDSILARLAPAFLLVVFFLSGIALNNLLEHVIHRVGGSHLHGSHSDLLHGHHHNHGHSHSHNHGSHRHVHQQPTANNDITPMASLATTSHRTLHSNSETQLSSRSPLLPHPNGNSSNNVTSPIESSNHNSSVRRNYTTSSFLTEKHQQALLSQQQRPKTQMNKTAIPSHLRPLHGGSGDIGSNSTGGSSSSVCRSCYGNDQNQQQQQQPPVTPTTATSQSDASLPELCGCAHHIDLTSAALMHEEEGMQTEEDEGDAIFMNNSRNVSSPSVSHLGNKNNDNLIDYQCKNPNHLHHHKHHHHQHHDHIPTSIHPDSNLHTPVATDSLSQVQQTSAKGKAGEEQSNFNVANKSMDSTRKHRGFNIYKYAGPIAIVPETKRPKEIAKELRSVPDDCSVLHWLRAKYNDDYVPGRNQQWINPPKFVNLARNPKDNISDAEMLMDVNPSKPLPEKLKYFHHHHHHHLPNGAVVYEEMAVVIGHPEATIIQDRNENSSSNSKMKINVVVIVRSDTKHDHTQCIANDTIRIMKRIGPEGKIDEPRCLHPKCNVPICIPCRDKRCLIVLGKLKAEKQQLQAMEEMYTYKNDLLQALQFEPVLASDMVARTFIDASVQPPKQLSTKGNTTIANEPCIDESPELIKDSSPKATGISPKRSFNEKIINNMAENNECEGKCSERSSTIDSECGDSDVASDAFSVYELSENDEDDDDELDDVESSISRSSASSIPSQGSEKQCALIDKAHRDIHEAEGVMYPNQIDESETATLLSTTKEGNRIPGNNDRSLHSHSHVHGDETHQHRGDRHEHGNRLLPSAQQLRGKRADLYRTGLNTALAIAMHKFPEGFVIFTSSGFYPNRTIAATILIALCLHNVAEGLAISLPIYLATGNRMRSFIFACCMCTVSPFVGAGLELLIADLISWHRGDKGNDGNGGNAAASPLVFGCVFAVISGMLLWIVVDGMAPSARRILLMPSPPTTSRRPRTRSLTTTTTTTRSEGLPDSRGRASGAAISIAVRDGCSNTVVTNGGDSTQNANESRTSRATSPAAARRNHTAEQERAKRTVTLGVVSGIAMMLLCDSLLAAAGVEA